MAESSGVAETAATDLTPQVARGAAWMVSARWVVRGLDSVMTVILARLLVPDDFGVFATAALTVGLLEVLSQAGIDIAIIRQRQAGAEYYNAAWTIQLVQGLLVALALYSGAPLIARCFEEPRIESVVRILALHEVRRRRNRGMGRFLRGPGD